MNYPLLHVGQMARFSGKVGEITAVNRTRYVAVGTDGGVYTVPFNLASPLDDYSGPKPTASLPTFTIGQRVVTHAPRTRFHGIHGVVIKITRTTIKMMPDGDDYPITGPVNFFRAEV